MCPACGRARPKDRRRRGHSAGERGRGRPWRSRQRPGQDTARPVTAATGHVRPATPFVRSFPALEPVETNSNPLPLAKRECYVLLCNVVSCSVCVARRRSVVGTSSHTTPRRVRSESGPNGAASLLPTKPGNVATRSGLSLCVLLPRAGLSRSISRGAGTLRRGFEAPENRISKKKARPAVLTAVSPALNRTGLIISSCSQPAAPLCLPRSRPRVSRSAVPACQRPCAATAALR